MNLAFYYQYCINKKGVTEHFPFDKDVLVFKVGNKMFALSSLKSWEANQPKINLKCDPEYAVELRENYQGITPGYHMSKKHWNTLEVNSLEGKLIIELIDQSYDLVVQSLPKNVKNNL